MLKRILILFISLMFTMQSFAIVSLDNLLLGDLSSKLASSKADPLNYVFKVDDSLTATEQDKAQLGFYRGLYEEGENLTNKCANDPYVFYQKPNDERRIARSLVATLQYIGLDLTGRALGAYVNHFKFTDDEKDNFRKHLMTNYCSENITVISLQTLDEFLNRQFKESNNFSLPDLKDNNLFHSDLDQVMSLDKVKSREFKLTQNLFRAFCSWGGSVEDLRLLVPLVKNPTIMAFIARQLAGVKIHRDKTSNRLYVREDKDTVRVLCDSLICRRKEYDLFNELVPLSSGATSMKEDFERNYCKTLEPLRYVIKNQNKKILKWMDETPLEEDLLMTGQFIALLTGIPELTLRVDKFNQLKKLSKLGFEKTWDYWALTQVKNFSKDIYYEEPLIIEKVDRNLYKKNTSSDFKVKFDINLGEYDRVNQLKGKLKLKFSVFVTKRFLAWARRQWLIHDPTDDKQVKMITTSMGTRIRDDVRTAARQLKVAPWNDRLANLITYELLDQLASYQGNYFEDKSDWNQVVEIPIEMYYGLFALKYVRYQYYIAENAKE